MHVLSLGADEAAVVAAVVQRGFPHRRSRILGQIRRAHRLGRHLGLDLDQTHAVLRKREDEGRMREGRSPEQGFQMEAVGRVNHRGQRIGQTMVRSRSGVAKTARLRA